MKAGLLGRAILVHVPYIYIISFPVHVGAYSAVLAGGHELVFLDIRLCDVVGIGIQIFEHCIYTRFHQLARLNRVNVIGIQFFKKISINVQILRYFEIRVACLSPDK